MPPRAAKPGCKVSRVAVVFGARRVDVGEGHV